MKEKELYKRYLKLNEKMAKIANFKEFGGNRRYKI